MFFNLCIIIIYIEKKPNNFNTFFHYSAFFESALQFETAQSHRPDPQPSLTTVQMVWAVNQAVWLLASMAAVVSLRVVTYQ